MFSLRKITGITLNGLSMTIHLALCEDFDHKIWVGDMIGSPYRYGTVKKTVAYVCIDEDEFGLPVVEKWDLKKCQKYPKKA